MKGKKGGSEVHKFENLKAKKSFFGKIKSIFDNFLEVFF